MVHRLMSILALMFVVSIGFSVGAVSAADTPYLGNGRFATKYLRLRYWGPASDSYGSYTTPAGKAAQGWDYYTNLSLSWVNDNNYHALVYVDNFGAVTWNGWAYICSTNGACNNATAVNGWFRYCWAKINTYKMRSTTQVQRQQTMTHELGHCFSLGHRDSQGYSSVMYPTGPTNYPWPNATDAYLINQRYR